MKNIEINIKQSDGTYEVLYPKVNSNTSVISNEVAIDFGLNENSSIDDVLKNIGLYKQHWWRRRTPDNVKWVEKRIDTFASETPLTFGGRNQWAEVSSSISFNSETGENIALVNPKKITLDGWDSVATGIVQVSKITDEAPCYVKFANINLDENTYYLPEGATVSSWADFNSNGTLQVRYQDNPWRVYIYGKDNSKVTKPASKISTEQVYIPPSDWSYLQSINYNAYPHEGIQDGYKYEYLGIPFENMPVASKIEIGRYMGNGTFGVSNPNILTFKFAPKLVLVGDTRQPTIFQRGKTEGTTWTESCSGSFYNCSFQGNSLSWYVDSTSSWYGGGGGSTGGGEAKGQLNIANQIYKYIAIG